jgi:hypothetical protein
MILIFSHITLVIRSFTACNQVSANLVNDPTFLQCLITFLYRSCIVIDWRREPERDARTKISWLITDDENGDDDEEGTYSRNINHGFYH